MILLIQCCFLLLFLYKIITLNSNHHSLENVTTILIGTPLGRVPNLFIAEVSCWCIVCVGTPSRTMHPCGAKVAVVGTRRRKNIRARDQRQRQRLRGLRRPGRYRGQRTSTLSTSTMSTAKGPATTRPPVEVNAVSGSNANDKLRRRQLQRQRLRGLRQPGSYRGQQTSTLYVNVMHHAR